jgi:hypothetical protein
VKGILADINVVGQVVHLVKLMQAEPRTEFWNDLGLVLHRFEDLGLPATAKGASALGEQMGMCSSRGADCN